MRTRRARPAGHARGHEAHPRPRRSSSSSQDDFCANPARDWRRFPRRGRIDSEERLSSAADYRFCFAGGIRGECKTADGLLRAVREQKAHRTRRTGDENPFFLRDDFMRRKWPAPCPGRPGKTDTKPRTILTAPRRRGPSDAKAKKRSDETEAVPSVAASASEWQNCTPWSRMWPRFALS